MFMQVIYTHCAGLDVHKKSVAACVWITSPSGKAEKRVGQFGTTTPDLQELVRWLQGLSVSHIAMESTGVYWRPVYEILEEAFSIIVVNAQHVHALPGRKTDMADAEWLGDLLRHGLLKPSYVPPRWQRELRELVRFRRNLVQRRAQVANELQKTLELANIKLASVVSDITGVSATEMLQHMVAGTGNPESLSELGRGALRKKKEALARALTGRLREHHRVILTQQLAEISSLEEDIRAISDEIQKRTQEHQALIERLDEIPGVNRRVAEVVIAEMGVNPKVFDDNPKRAMAWAGVCPGNHESGGKRRQAKVRLGNRTLTTAAVEAALAAIHTKKSYFGSLYRRLVGRRGHKRAVVAVAHAILKTCFMMILRGTRYSDLGTDYFDRLRPKAVAHRLMRRLHQLGFEVELKLKPVPS
jgi:transposase